ncbi:FadR/GntR family transcriptional regulator [Liquorilactobacillus nagelii]|uniref:FadR/GntR family transcriptional regulator n=1 Tax=Liquorilactobacillus nagelii TaxID=82688 RepID=UPI0039EC47A4
MTELGKNSAIDKALDYFIKEISNGNWKVGEKIPSENKLTALTGVSRSSIRSAIQQSIGIGAMESFHGRGTYLLTSDMTGLGQLTSTINLREDTLRSFLEFRLIIETGIAGLAAIRRTQKQLNELTSLFKNMQKYKGNKNKFVLYDVLFHESIAKASDNNFALMTIMDAYKKQNDVFYAFNDEFGLEDGIYYHKKIINAIEKKDASAAKSSMHDHLKHAIDRLGYS